MSTAKEREPSEIELLLPWYAAGTLGVSEAQAVEAALARDPELARRYEWVRAEFAGEMSLGEAAGKPAADDVKTLFARIDALPAREPAASFDLAARIADFLSALSPRTLAWSAVAAGLAIVLQAGVLAGFLIKERTAGGYETASQSTNVAGDGAFVLMRFKPEASSADIAAFLATNKLSIVGGPFGGALYRVRVASTKLGKDDLTRIVTTLQSDKVVGFIAATD
jgi:anti-sigma factor RsiW